MTTQDLDFFKEKLGDLNEGFGYEYNIFCCEQAIIIATALQTKDKIIEFNKADSNTQFKMVPGLSDDHSGNTFGMSCKIAIAYIPRLIENVRDEKIDIINS